MTTVFELDLLPETKRRMQRDSLPISDEPKCSRCGGRGKACQRRPELKQRDVRDIPEETLKKFSIVWPPVTAFATGNG